VGAPPAFDAAAPATAHSPEVVEPHAIARPETPVVSATALAHFDACPRRYFLKNVVRWPVAPSSTHESDADERREEILAEDAELSAAAGPRAELELFPAPESAARAEEAGGAEFGTVVHALLAGLDAPEADPEVLEAARALAAQFERSALGQKATRAARVGRETDVLFEFEGLLVRGVIDLWFEDDGELVLVDYKTDRQISAERQAEYATQLALYTVALERALGRPVNRAVLADLRNDAEIDVTPGPDRDGRLAALVARFRQAHVVGDFAMRPSRECERCEYFQGACPAEWVSSNKD
jgi:ATP-dependent exoDNAse (exonuclease V) beta subunit